jgi:hypothetical protein
MKTKNNVQQAISHSTALVIGLVLTGFTGIAQGSTHDFFADTHSGANAEIRDNKSSVTVEAFIRSEAMVLEMKSSLALEAWMFAGSDYDVSTISYEKETELPLEIENWMMEDIQAMTFEQEEEAPLGIESWMTNNNRAFTFEHEEETSLKLEDWMFSHGMVNF